MPALLSLDLDLDLQSTVSPMLPLLVDQQVILIDLNWASDQALH